MSLAGKTLFITGASRGIGLAIALRAARDGANIAIAAKTAEPHPKLPGTIYTAAAEIERAGGKALPMVVDVREEASVAGGGAALCGHLRWHRHLHQQCLGDQPLGHRADRHEALRPDPADQHARHLRHLARLHPVPEAGRQPARPDALAAAGLQAAVVREPPRVLLVQVRHVAVHARAGRGVPRGRDRLQRPVAAHDDRHRGDGVCPGRHRP